MGKKLILSGRVQGVNCRYFCSRCGKKLEIRGSASNLIDGTVQVLLDTDNEKIINKYIDLLKNNPHEFYFIGNITDIKVYEYSGPIHGDYDF